MQPVMVCFSKGKKFLDKVVSKAKKWFSGGKSEKWGKAIPTFADSIGWGYVEDKFWNFTVGKTAFGILASGFSFGSLIVSTIDFYQ